MRRSAPISKDWAINTIWLQITYRRFINVISFVLHTFNARVEITRLEIVNDAGRNLQMRKIFPKLMTNADDFRFR